MRSRLAALAVAFAAALVASASGCGPSTGSLLEVRGPTEALVGEELQISLRAAVDAQLGFELDTWFTDRPTRPTLQQLDGEGTFRFRPLGGDVGTLPIVFTAESNGVVSRVPWDVAIAPPLAAMVFRQPLGEGTTFDPSDGACVAIPLAVDHASATEVTFSGGDAWPEDAVIEQTGALTGVVHFCPSAEALLAQSLFPLALVAEDGFGSRVEKRYVLVAEVPAP